MKGMYINWHVWNAEIEVAYRTKYLHNPGDIVSIVVDNGWLAVKVRIEYPHGALQRILYQGIRCQNNT